MRRYQKILLFTLIGVVALTGVTYAAMKLYAESSAGRSFASARLTDVLGMPVQVENLDIGLCGTKATLRVLESGPSPSVNHEWLEIKSVETDVSLPDLLLNRAAPTWITVSGLNVTLRLDRDGNLLTRLPTNLPHAGGGAGAVPAITLKDAGVRIEQEGRPPFQLTGASLQVQAAEANANITGSIDDPHWGSFTMTGQVVPKNNTGQLAIDSKACNVDVDRLRSIPWIPTETWQHLQPQGKSRFHAEVQGTLESIDYRVTFQPEGQADFHMPDLGEGKSALIQKVVGTIQLNDQGIEVQQVKGALADGTITVNGQVRYEPSPTSVHLQVQAAGMDVRQLPPEWNLPTTLEGTLRGEAKLAILIHNNGTIEPRGGGNAVIDLTNLPPGASGDISFRLHSNGKQYRFQSMEPAEQPERKSSQRRITKRSRVLCAGQAPVAKAPPIKSDSDQPTTIDAALNLRNIDIAELLKQLKISIPYKLEGKVTTRLTIAVPLDKAGTFSAYRLTGRLESPLLKVEDLSVQDFTADLTYEKGVLSLVALKGSLPRKDKSTPGTFLGKATAQLEPRGDLTASLEMSHLPIGELLRAFLGPQVAVNGDIDGTMRFSGPVEELKDPQKWTASASVQSAELHVFGRTVTKTNMTLAIQKGVATFSDTHAIMEGLPVAGNATLALTEGYRFRIRAVTGDESVADVSKLLAGLPIPLAISGKFKVEADVDGTLSPFAYKASGTMAGREVMLGTVPNNTLAFDWAVDDKAVTVTRLLANVFRGTLTGSANLPMASDRDGQVNVQFKELDSALVTKSLEKFPLALTGKVSGQFKGTVPATRREGDPAVAGDLDLSAEAMTVQGLPASRLTGQVRFVNEAADYKLEGHTLGGTFDLQGRYPFRQPKPEARGPNGQLNLRNIDLGRLSADAKQPALAPLGGTVNLALSFSDDFTEGFGRFEVLLLTWNTKTLSDRVSGVLQMQDRILSIRDVNGAFAGGQLRAFARLVSPDPQRNFFRVVITAANSETLLGILPAAKDVVKGQISLNLTGRLDKEYSTGTGHIELNRGAIFGVGMSGLHVPIQWTLRGLTAGEVQVRNAYMQSSQGRMTGTLSYRWGIRDQLDGHVEFQNLLLRSLMGSSSAGLFGAGRINGRLDIGGSGIRSVNDIRGTLRATLNNTSVRELPILSVAMPFLNVAGLATPFQSGDLVGRFQNGIFYLERLALSNSSAQLFGSGIVLLSTGQLNLNVVALTGNFSVGSRGLVTLASRIPAFGPVPLSVIQDISDFLSNRTIRLTIGGTIKNPVVQVNTAALLADEAIRFFLGRYVLGAAGIQSIYSAGRK